jgi:hypothetical protein
MRTEMLRTLGLALGLLLACTTQAWAAAAIVQMGPAVTSINASPLTLTLSSAPSSSNLVVLEVINDASSDGGNTSNNTSASISTPSGFTAGPTFTYDTGTSPINPFIVAFFYRTGITSTSFSVTFAASTGAYVAGDAFEVSGANNSSPTNGSNFNQSVGTTSTPLSLTGPSVTPSVSGTLAVGGFDWNDDTAYSGPDLQPGNQQTGWTESLAPYQPTDVAGNYPGLEIQTLASPTSGTAIHPVNIQKIYNDNDSSTNLHFIGFLWVIAPAAASSPSYGLYPQEGVYPGGKSY